MNTQYLIQDTTLSDIAEAIRYMDETTAPINVEDYSDRILQLKPSTEDYMRISDHLKYPEPINEANYAQSEIDKTDALIKFYSEMEG